MCVRVHVFVVFDRSVYVCVWYAECRVAVDLLDRVSDVGQVHLFVCVCLCVVLGRSVYVCVSYVECGVGVDLLERLTVWC